MFFSGITPPVLWTWMPYRYSIQNSWEGTHIIGGGFFPTLVFSGSTRLSLFSSVEIKHQLGPQSVHTHHSAQVRPFSWSDKLIVVNLVLARKGEAFWKKRLKVNFQHRACPSF